MRSPFSGLRRDHVDFLEGRLRGRAVHTPERVEEETLKHRGQGLPFLDSLRSASSPLDAVRALAGTMLGAAYGHASPPVDESARLDLRAYEAVLRLLDELAGWQELGQAVGVEDVAAALERVQLRLGSAAEPGRVAVLDLLRARTRRFEVVFVLGLEEGSLPRRSETPRLLDDDTRRALEASTRVRLPRPEPVARERYLFYTACTRATRAPLPRPRGGDRRRLARARRARSGTTSAASSTRRTSRAGRPAGRCRRSSGRSATLPAIASGCARRRRSRRRIRPGRAISPGRTAGSGASTARSARSGARPR